MKRAIITIAIILMAGEVMVRVDKGWIRTRQQEVVAIEIEESDLLKRVNAGEYEPDDSVLRVLVLGDSYIYGAGVEPAMKTSKVLGARLEDDWVGRRGTIRSVEVLDVSRPSNNSLDNLLAMEMYGERFRPHFVVLGYNWNDILGGLRRQNVPKPRTEGIPEQVEKEVSTLKSLILTIYGVTELGAYLSTQIQHSMKQHGFILPIGDFHLLTQVVYEESSPQWRASHEVLSDLGRVARANGAMLVVYDFPEFNLLEQPQLFDQPRRVLSRFFTDDLADVYIDGWKHFEPVAESQWYISKYDGHLNGLAHARVAERIAEEIGRLPASTPLKRR